MKRCDICVKTNSHQNFIRCITCKYNKEKTKKITMANIIVLEQTCECCPEQYWAKKGSHTIGYIRLRWGHLTCDYLPKGYLTDNDIRVYDKTFNERADDKFKGSFDTEEEREYWLSKCKEALLNKYNELKRK